jgi:cytochrome P450
VAVSNALVDRRRLPPGPKSALWQTLRYLRDPVGTVLDLVRRYGAPFTFPMPGRPLVVTGHPERIRSIFAADPDTFESMATEPAILVLGRGSLMVQSGAPHRRARKLMQPPFHGARLAAYGAAMQATARAHLARVPKGRRVPVEDLFRRISLEVIVRTIFGVEANDRVRAVGRAVLDGIAAFSPPLAMFSFLRRSFFGLGPWARFKRLHGAAHAMLREEIAARRAEAGPGEDILSLLLAARDEEGAPMDEQEIVDQLFTMVLAGHETTATALAWAVDEVYRDPGLVERLRAEIAATGLRPEEVAKAPLLDAVCQETLRLRPLIPLVSRGLARPFVLDGIELPAGAGVAACLVAAHRNPEVYPDPEAFRPERFLSGRAAAPPLGTFFPFGGGARRCLGATFAQYEMKQVLATFVAEAGEVRLASPERARVGARTATIGPRGGVPVVLSARSTSSP